MSKLAAKGDRDCHRLMQFLSATVRQQLLREDPTGARERRVCEGSAQQYAGQGQRWTQRRQLGPSRRGEQEGREEGDADLASYPFLSLDLFACCCAKSIGDDACWDSGDRASRGKRLGGRG
ncbi:hypothetical protein L7F22_065014, partial [Adiantum nelumboides]|nr:hypothetical protein [Adiantum nelumboides]